MPEATNSTSISSPELPLDSSFKRRQSRSNSNVFGASLLQSFTNSIRSTGIFDTMSAGNTAGNESAADTTALAAPLIINVPQANGHELSNSFSDPNVSTPNIPNMIIADAQENPLIGTLDPSVKKPTKSKSGSYSMRLTPYVDNNSSSSALYFGPIIRKLQAATVIQVGRYTEKNKDALTAAPNSSAPVVFKSKVVSRTHAEITVDADGNWFLKDLGSSSGTFLNHRRLSQASQESESHKVKEGDLLQLGMDFRGGTEEIYRCVKMRVELNKSWIRKTKAFTREAHARMKLINPEFDKGEKIQCVICLEDLKPYQAMFTSPCSHSYHYKCIRRVILRTYPQFSCPTCRALSDLEANEESDSSDEEDEDTKEDQVMQDTTVELRDSGDESFRSLT